MPRFEFKCERCQQVVERAYPSFKAMCLEQAVRCEHDGSRMERIPSTTAFTVGGNYTAKNGYSKVKP